MRTLNVDCFGKSFAGEFSARVDGVDVRFIFDETQKRSVAFSFALFLDDAAMDASVRRYPHERRVAALLESPIRPVFEEAPRLAPRFRSIYTHSRALVDRGDPFQFFAYGTSWLGGVDLSAEFPKDRTLSFIGSIRHGDDHGYALRKRLAARLIDDSRVDCYGYGIREIPAKIQALGPYAFSVALENVRTDYYFTEKLLDCFLTDTVPIYWGCPGITDLFDERGMLTFETESDLGDILAEVSLERHRAMLPFVRENKRRAMERGWHTVESLYQRLATTLVGELGCPAPITVRPRIVRALEAAERLRHRLLR